MYVALIPERPRFEAEHLTLVWCGNVPLEYQITEATRLVAEINSALHHPSTQKDVSVVSSWERFGSKWVAVLDVPYWIWRFRQKAVDLNLNVSQYTTWRPHISASNGERPRQMNSIVRFERAELR